MPTTQRASRGGGHSPGRNEEHPAPGHSMLIAKPLPNDHTTRVQCLTEPASERRSVDVHHPSSSLDAAASAHETRERMRGPPADPGIFVIGQHHVTTTSVAPPACTRAGAKAGIKRTGPERNGMGQWGCCAVASRPTDTADTPRAASSTAANADWAGSRPPLTVDLFCRSISPH